MDLSDRYLNTHVNTARNCSVQEQVFPRCAQRVPRRGRLWPDACALSRPFARPGAPWRLEPVVYGRANTSPTLFKP